MGLIARLLLLLAAPIAALFVARDALNFNVVQMIVAVGLFTACVAAVAFWPRRTPPRASLRTKVPDQTPAPHGEERATSARLEP